MYYRIEKVLFFSARFSTSYKISMNNQLYLIFSPTQYTLRENPHEEKKKCPWKLKMKTKTKNWKKVPSI